MTVYMIIDSKIRDQQKYSDYIDKVPETIKKYGGKYLARGGAIIPLGGKWKPERIIILEFPILQLVYDWLGSEEYKSISRLREEGGDTQAIIVDGESIDNQN